MRRITSVFMILTMLVPAAFAAGELKHLTIQELYSQSGGQRWQNEYQTVRGEIVSVDVEIGIPNVQAFPCLEAEMIGPSEQLPKTKNGLAHTPEQDDFEYENGPDYFLYACPSRSVRRRMMKAAQKNGTLKEQPGDVVHQFLTWGRFDLDARYAMNNPCTVRDVTEQLNSVVQEYFPDEEVQLIPHMLEAYVEAGKWEENKKTGEFTKVKDAPDFDGYLFVRYNQLLEGIPVFGASAEGFFDNNSGKEIRGLDAVDMITAGMTYMGSDELYWHVVLKLLKVSKMKQKDIPLTPVDIILSATEEYIHEGKLRSVDSMRLGYAAWPKKNGGFTLMPVWCIEGEVFPDAKSVSSDRVSSMETFHHQPSAYMKLYINAQTGKVLDPNTSGKDRQYQVPKLITW